MHLPRYLSFTPRLLLVLCLIGISCARAADAPTRSVLTVDGVSREALVYAPANANSVAAPVIFAWHGHGGNMSNAMRMYGYHLLWPEAIVVYPQGLNTPGKLTDPQGLKPGWQHSAGAQGDRDLKFFDAMLAELRSKFKVNDKRLYSTGHSNGGGFTYLLWAERGDLFTAMAPSAAAAPTLLDKLKPKPVLHVAGQTDPLVKFAWQQQTIEALRKLNQCGEGKPWESQQGGTIYESKLAMPVITLLHPGGHQFIPQAPAAIVKFFKAHTKP